VVLYSQNYYIIMFLKAATSCDLSERSMKRAICQGHGGSKSPHPVKFKPTQFPNQLKPEP